MAPLKTVIFMGSTRPSESPSPVIPGRLADRVCKFLVGNMAPDEFEVRVVDPSDDEYKLPLLEVPFHFAKFAKQPVSPALKKLVETATWADAYIFLSPEYNHTIGPALINLVNHLPPAVYGGPLANKAGLIITYSMGKFGGSRAAVQLRSLVAEAGAVVCPSALSIAEAHIFMDEEGNEIAGDGNTPITDNFQRAKNDLLFVGRALLKERQAMASAKASKKGKL